MVHSGNPCSSLSLHSCMSNHGVLHGICESMTHVEGSRYVWWWYGYDELALWFDFSIFRKLRFEVVSLLPPVISTFLNLLRLVGIDGGCLFYFLLLGFRVAVRG